MRMRHHVLLVEADESAAAAVARQLVEDGFVVSHRTTVHAALQELNAAPADLVVTAMDLDVHGVDLLKHVRTSELLRSVPVIVLGHRNDEIDRVVAFELGADDVVVKSVSARELSLRVRAILGRVRTRAVASARPGRVVAGPLIVDWELQEARVDGRLVPLSPLEIRLLSHLASRPGAVVTRRALLHDVWRDEDRTDTRAVDSSIKRLRQKLGPAGRRIETVRGVGYRFRTPSEAAG